jgi:hypothetical protein
MRIGFGLAFVVAAMLATYPAMAQKAKDDDDDQPKGRRSQSGLLSGIKKLDPITLSSGKPVAKGVYELESGRYYRLPITSDGTAELGLSGSDFFRNIWVNEIVVNGIEIRPMGVESIEFDQPGTATVSFVTIRPGTFTLRIPNTTSDSQAAVFKVK